MCVYLCASPHVHEWLDLTVARWERAALQLSALCPPDPFATRPHLEEGGVLDEAAVRNLVRGPMLREPGWDMRSIGRRYDGASSHEWNSPLDALSNTWSRLLILIGWRR